MASIFRTPTPRQVSLGLAILRIVTGIVFVMHGGQKLFVYGFSGVTGAFTQMGIPMPGVAGPLVALVEFLGGLALVFGLLTRLAALGLVAVMLGAIVFVHLKAGFFAPEGFEFPLTLLAAALALVFTGPGALSADEAVFGRRDRLRAS